jgi:hypothetical protein
MGARHRNRGTPDSSRRDARAPTVRPGGLDNLGSIRVLEKTGFRRVAVDRDFALGRGVEIEERMMRLD